MHQKPTCNALEQQFQHLNPYERAGEVGVRLRSLSTLLLLCPSYSCRITTFPGMLSLSIYSIGNAESLDSVLRIPFPKTGTCKSDVVKPHQHALLRMCPSRDYRSHQVHITVYCSLNCTGCSMQRIK